MKGKKTVVPLIEVYASSTSYTFVYEFYENNLNQLVQSGKIAIS